MSHPMSLRSKLTLLVAIAFVFGATMVALSVKRVEPSDDETRYWSEGKNFDRTFSVKPGDKLILDADEGDVHIIGSDSDEMSIHVVLNGRDSQLKNYRVEMDQSGSVVTVRSRRDRRMFRWFDDNSLEIRFEIQLPRKFNLKLGTCGGNLRIENIEGNIFGETSGGDVVASDLMGTVKLSTSGGNMNMKKLVGEITMETSGGDVNGEDVSGTIRAETSGGNIKFIRAEGAVHAETSGGDIRVELTGNKGIDLSTSGGNIVVSLPKTAAGNVDAETSGGEISCDFAFSGKLQEGSLHGKINGGGGQIHLETSGGDILIHAVE